MEKKLADRVAVYLQPVVTYAWAYVAGRVSLCEAHTSEESRKGLPFVHGPLGAVEHGSHDGFCDACEVEVTFP